MRAASDSVIQWLLDADGSDPAIRWQVMRDLLDRPEDEWRAERAKIESEGWGARLLQQEDEDGQWAGGAHFPKDFVWGGDEPGQPWTSTSHSLTQLRLFGLEPDSDRIQASVRLIGENSQWEYDDLPFWGGEVEPCINGMTVANGSYFGVDMAPLVRRLVSELLSDGGWNCEAENGSLRSSFDTTINVLEGLLEFERATGGTPQSTAARKSGEEYLLQRHLYRRLSTGRPADPDYVRLANPNRWQYDVLRALDYFRAASVLTGAGADPRVAEAIEIVRSKQLADGTWPLELRPEGRVWFHMEEGPGAASRWVTLRAQRVLDWWAESGPQR